jgi:hypothetical protein
MMANERRLLRKRLDKEMLHYRLAGREKDPTNGLLKAVREALRIPLKEIQERMGVGRSAVFDLEEREGTGSIMLRSLERMAEAMGCKVVYGGGSSEREDAGKAGGGADVGGRFGRQGRRKRVSKPAELAG